MDLETIQAPLHIEAAPEGFRAWFLADSTPEDPAGDSGRLLVQFQLDASGRFITGSARPLGIVSCTFTPVCTGEEELEIDYVPNGRAP